MNANAHGTRKPTTQLIAGDLVRAPFSSARRVVFVQVRVSALGTPVAVEATLEDGTTRLYGPRETILTY